MCLPLFLFQTLSNRFRNFSKYSHCPESFGPEKNAFTTTRMTMMIKPSTLTRFALRMCIHISIYLSIYLYLYISLYLNGTHVSSSFFLPLFLHLSSLNSLIRDNFRSLCSFSQSTLHSLATILSPSFSFYLSLSFTHSLQLG